MTTVMAFSNALRVRMSRGRDAALDQVAPRPRRRGGSRRACRRRSRPARSCSAGSGRAPRSPRPWCWPCTCRRTSRRRGRRAARGRRAPRPMILPAACCPTASNTETMSTGLPLPDAGQDGAAVDEHRRAIEPRHRHQRSPACSCRSRRWRRGRRSPRRPTTVSIESAITSRDTSEYFMPSVPIEMPSEMVMVLKITALPPAASTPAAACARPAGRCACCTASPGSTSSRCRSAASRSRRA